MNSFRDQPYLSSNRSTWVELMNKSTADWGLSPFPANLVALNGSLADAPAGSVPADAIVIENAGQKLAGDRPIEPIVFGITTSLAVLGIVIFLIVGFRTRSLGLSSEVLLPGDDRNERRPLGALEEGGSGPSSPNPAAGGGRDFMTDKDFQDSLHNYYYPPINTETELRGKDFVTESVDGEDIEETTELLRRMYATDLEIWSRDGDRTFDPRVHQAKSDAILDEVRERFASWGVGSTRVDWHSGITQVELAEGWEALDAATLLGELREGLGPDQMDGAMNGLLRAGWSEDELPELVRAGLLLFSPSGIPERRYS